MLELRDDFPEQHWKQKQHNLKYLTRIVQNVMLVFVALPYDVYLG